MRSLTALLLVVPMMLAACSADDATLTTLQEEMEEAGGDFAAAISDAQEEVADIGQRIQDSEASEDLQSAWEEVQADLTELFTSLQTEGTVDTDQLEQVMNDFEARLDEAEDEIGPEIREAWDRFRAEIEQLVEEAG